MIGAKRALCPQLLNMNFYLFVLGVFSVWRLTHLLHAEDGPWDLLARLRSRAGNGAWASLLDCFYCLSLWTAAPIAFLIGGTWRHMVILWLALSAGAILIDDLFSRKQSRPKVYYIEDKETPDVVLRPEEKVPPENVRAGL